MKALHRSRILLAAVPLAGIALAAAGCGSGAANAPVPLDAGPATAAFVAPVHVSISGLPATGLVTVQAQMVGQKGQPWQSAAVFRASTAGTLNLSTAVPVSGSYHTADAAGLLWSLHPASPNNTTNPLSISAPAFTVRLTALTGGHVRATATLQRQLTVTASTQTVRQDGFAGTLYTSAAVKPGPPPSSRSTATVRTVPPPKGSRSADTPPWRWATTTNPGCRRASAPSRWSISPRRQLAAHPARDPRTAGGPVRRVR